MKMAHPNIYHRFQQREIQTDGGWCTGISLHLQAHLVEKKRVLGRPLVALEAYGFIEAKLKAATSDTHMLWGELQQVAGLSYRAPEAKFPLPLGEPFRVISLVANVGYLTSFSLLDPGSLFDWGMGKANHACLMLPGADGLMFFEPNWGLAYWSQERLPSEKAKCFKLLNAVISWGYNKVGQSHRTGYVIDLYGHAESSFGRALQSAVENMV